MPKAPTRPKAVFYMPTATALLRGDAAVTGGAETQVLMLARALVERGHRVGIVAFADGRALPRRVHGVEVIAQRTPRIGVPVLRTIDYWIQTVVLLARMPASVLVQRAAGIHTFLVAVAAGLRRRRFVYASASLMDFDLVTWGPRRWIARLFDVAVRWADEVVVQTGEQVGLCRERFGREPVLIRSLVAPPASVPAPEVQPEAFLWMGRLSGLKRPLAYLELAGAIPEARFRMVAEDLPGDEGQRIAGEVRRRARELPNFELLPARPQEQLAPLIGEAVAVVNTSEVEGMPNVFLEGWSRGVPALALSHDPDGVIARERLGGFAGGDAGRLAQLARELWRDRGDRSELSVRCRDFVAREHGLERTVDAWASVLRLDGS